MDFLLKLSGRTPVVVDPSTSVLAAVETMSKNRVGAVGVVNDGKLIGIFTERDVMQKVVLKSLDPKTTSISSVMTSPVESVRSSDEAQVALQKMLDRHIRHLPIVDDSQRMIGMLSIRDLLQNQLEKATQEAESLEAFLTADGPGG